MIYKSEKIISALFARQELLQQSVQVFFWFNSPGGTKLINFSHLIKEENLGDTLFHRSANFNAVRS